MDTAQDLDYRYLIQNQQNYDESLQKREQIIEYDYKIISFRIGDEYYGINIMNVNSILKHEKFTRVPNVLDFVIGVFSLRGEILPVIDVARMFHLKSTGSENKLKSII
ncbi:MAG: chemotaxis protein CheW, partial [Spirochaetes bacterium]|nr:chemotaxis protein CheW [Spirochaetota bacterium]